MGRWAYHIHRVFFTLLNVSHCSVLSLHPTFTPKIGHRGILQLLKTISSFIKINQFIELIIVKKMFCVRYFLSIPISIIQILEKLNLDPILLLVGVIVMLGESLSKSLVNDALFDLWANQLLGDHFAGSLDITFEAVR